ncbi:glycogen debranching N-terminal domain-containing protein [Streptomyces sp. NPDC048845]|uniref:amylo-alpha-1,6-glucosidase n=1 Tax=Streptomyces sp. NPDC048845 TaxID=3155390 RepID=UPI003428F465
MSHDPLVRLGTFALLDPAGDITGVRGTSPDGLFLRDARHLSRWQLTLDGEAPAVLVPMSTDDALATAILTPPAGRGEPPPYTVVREQAVAAGALVERLRFTNNRAEPCTARPALTVDADFADQFELRSDDRTYDKGDGRRTRRTRPDGLEFDYRRGTWHSRTTVTAHPAPATADNRTLHWQLDLPPHGDAELTLRVTALPHGAAPPAPAPACPAAAAAETTAAAAAFTGTAPHPADWPELARACARGLADLAVLRTTATGPDGEEVQPPAAGVPWFLTLFGRDALLTSFFALPYHPDTAAATLAALAATQATETDPARVAEPGKIVHEIRHGELAHFGQVPYGRYYGSVDSTPLFLVLLDAHARQTGDPALARRLERHARAAAGWILRHLDDGGHLVYRADSEGLANQNWKDSPGAICDTGGRQARGAIAVAEAQGYAYDALLRTARLARAVWSDPAYADRLDAAAHALRARFHQDFFPPGQDFPALAVDGTGRPADALASDAGHLLWSGLLDRERGRAVGRRLLEPDFFSGWGVRTLAAGQAAYHPLSYHRGGIWPHDNAVIALGLARYGLHEEVRTLARALVDTAAHHDWRLPEVLAGYGRDAHPSPVPYPHACSPQAWAAATPLALLTALRTPPDEHPPPPNRNPGPPAPGL